MKKSFYKFRNNKTFPYVTAIVWILILIISYLSWDDYISKDIYNLALKEARTNFRKDVIYRRWNAKEGGVYVRVSDYTKPNKYLNVPNRDVETKDGTKLTLVNPAYMTRMVHKLENVGDSVKGHITSLKPIRLENKADKWETHALQLFENGVKEYSSLEKVRGTFKLRYMAPLVTEKPCLKCHAKQGYKLGDIRGGISISIPYQSYVSASKLVIGRLRTFHLLIGLLGLIGIIIVARGNQKFKKSLQESEEKFKSLSFLKKAILESPEGIVVFALDRNYCYLEFTLTHKKTMKAIWGSDIENGKNILEFINNNEDKKKAKENFDRALSGEQFALYEEYGDEKFGRLFYESRYSPIFDESEQIIGISVYVIDISEMRKAQQIIEDMLKDLEISSEELKNKNLELEKSKVETMTLIENLKNEIDERNRIESNLKDSEEKHRLISNLTSDYIFQTKIFEDGHQESVWVTGSFEKITGYTFDEFKAIGGWRATIHPDDLSVDEKGYGKICRNERTVVEVRTYKKDGSIAWVRSHGSPIWDDKNNRLLGVVGAVTDITEEKQNQLIQQIQYNIANAAVTSKTTRELISVVTEELSQIINTNELYIAFYNETTGMFKMDIYEDSRDKIETWKAEKSVSGYVMKKGKSTLLDKKQILELAESGEIDIIGILPELWLGVPIRINGKNIGIIAAQSYDDAKAFNISNVKALEIIANQLSLFIERKRAEEDSIRLSRAIIQSPVSVVITDYEGTIEYINPKFTQVTGYTLQEAFGQNPRILNAGEQTVDFYEHLWSTILSGKNWKGEFHNKRKNGELYWENALISPIVNDEGKITHFVAIKEDITEKKIMLEELTSAKEKAESSEKVKTEFLAQMSHEIRSPLNVILNFVSLIKSEMGSNVSEDIQFGFQSIDSSSNRIIRTIDLILNMTDLQAGTYEKSIREFDAERSISTLVTEYKQSAATKNIELKQSFNLPMMKIYSDEYAVTQILSNLIDNAIKYTDKGHVKLTAKKDEEEGLIISVADTGIGISEEFLPKLFSTFTQEEQGYTRSYDGNGLGMALVKRYCDLINAEISVKSKKGKGTTFTVVFPDLKRLKLKEK